MVKNNTIYRHINLKRNLPYIITSLPQIVNGVWDFHMFLRVTVLRYP